MTVLPQLYEVVPARPVTSGWVGNVLGPVVPFLKMKGSPPPIEFAPLASSFGGFTAFHSPGDGRVQISSKAVAFWSARNLLLVYVHEVAHRFCFRVGELGHGPVFAGTLAVFYWRIDQATTDYCAVRSLSLYDLQDCPPEFEGRLCSQWCVEVMRFGLECAAQLALADIAAEDVPGRVKELWEVRKSELLGAEALKAPTASDPLQVAVTDQSFGGRFLSCVQAIIAQYPVATLALIAGCFSLGMIAWQVAALVQQVHRM